MRPEARKPTDTEQKLIILKALGTLGSLTDLQLLNILSESGLMNYFDMMLTLNDLCAQGQCSVRAVYNGREYTLTRAGLEALTLFENKLPQSVRRSIDDTVHASAESVRTQQTCPAEYRQTSRGDYLLTMRVREQGTDMMTVSLNLPDERMAKAVQSRWPDLAPGMYRAFFEEPGEETT